MMFYKVLSAAYKEYSSRMTILTLIYGVKYRYVINQIMT